MDVLSQVLGLGAFRDAKRDATIVTFADHDVKVIKLIKLYRNINGLNIPNVIIEQCVVDALSRKNFGVSYSDTENVLNSLEWISRKVTQKTIIDLANTNNNLQNKVDDFDKDSVSTQIVADIAGVEKNPRFLMEIIES